MRSSRYVPFVLVLCLLLPGALAAAEACAMTHCDMAVEAAAHACCPQPEARLEADCCDGNAAPAELPAKARERAAAAASLHVFGTALALAPPRLVAAPPQEPASSPPRDLLARHCILRI